MKVKIKNFVKSLYSKNPSLTIFLTIMIAMIFIGLATFLIFLNRAGSSSLNNWPTNWDLSNSDNSILFQFSQDIFKARNLSWNFSPQVYIFPEIPISILSYALALGNVYIYFIFVAIINNCLLFLILLALTRTIYSRARYIDQIFGALLASMPLLLLPLLGSNQIFSYQLAPTYYFGAYLMALATPLIFYLRNTKYRLITSILYCLTAASNPLLIVFSVPSLLLIIVSKYFKNGLKGIYRITLEVLALISISMLIRRIFFSGFVGTSPSNYISIDLFAKRLHGIKGFVKYGFNNRLDHYLISCCVIALFISAILTLFYMRRYLMNKKFGEKYLSLIYINAIPVATLISIISLTIINILYLWPILVLPSIIILIQIPRRFIRKTLLIFTFFTIALLILPNSIRRTEHSVIYFNFKTPIAYCLDSKLPKNQSVGYATYSDAREAEITTNRNILLVQLLPLTNLNTWLTNKDYARDYTGTFFIINTKGAEIPINSESVIQLFGPPNKIIKCSQSVYIMDYTSKDAIINIRKHYDK